MSLGALKSNDKATDADRSDHASVARSALTNVQTTLFCKRAPKGTVCFNLAIHRWSAGFLGNSWLIDANALWSTIKLAGGHRARGASLFRTNSPTENGVSAERSAIALSALMRDVCGVSAASASDDV